MLIGRSDLLPKHLAGSLIRLSDLLRCIEGNEAIPDGPTRQPPQPNPLTPLASALKALKARQRVIIFRIAYALGRHGWPPAAVLTSVCVGRPDGPSGASCHSTSPRPDRRCSPRTRAAGRSASVPGPPAPSSEGTVGTGVAAVSGADACLFRLPALPWVMKEPPSIKANAAK
jgi:hypothetical protein